MNHFKKTVLQQISQKLHLIEDNARELQVKRLFNQLFGSRHLLQEELVDLVKQLTLMSVYLKPYQIYFTNSRSDAYFSHLFDEWERAVLGGQYHRVQLEAQEMTALIDDLMSIPFEYAA